MFPKKKTPTHAWVVVHETFGLMPNSNSNGLFVSQSAAVRRCGPRSRVLKFALINPEVVHVGKELVEKDSTDE